MTIIRDGKAYEVVDEVEDMYAVVSVFDYAEFPYKRELKMWWHKKHCTIIE